MSILRQRMAIAAAVGLLIAGLTGAAFHPEFPAATSQVQWMRDRGATFDHWDTGTVIFWPAEPTDESRGSHPQSTKCSACHFNGPPGTTPPMYPPDTWEAKCGTVCHNDNVVTFEAVNWSSWPREFEGQQGGTDYPCGTACHSWLGEIDEHGFPNLLPAAQGEASYKGSIDPLYLLSQDKDVDGDGRTHQAIYKEFGCRGFCHNPNIDRDDVNAWAAEGIAPDVERGQEHGQVTTCTQCHQFFSPLGGPADLHSTHIPFIQAEQPLANSGAAPTDTACGYCHGTAPGAQATGGGCYNCHLSGHRPETYYWNAVP